MRINQPTKKYPLTVPSFSTSRDNCLSVFVIPRGFAIEEEVIIFMLMIGRAFDIRLQVVVGDDLFELARDILSAV